MKTYVDAVKLQEYTTKLVAKLKTIFPTSPLVASTAAGMTDTSRIYVYTGSETGYTAGHWYYYDSTDEEWKDGGVYQSSGIETDTTLAVAGMAADAKATGDAIAAAKAAVLAEIAPAYSSSATYAVGDYVIYNLGLYRCTTAITTAEAWTSGHWTQVDLAADVADLKTQIYDFDDTILTDISSIYTWEQGSLRASNGTELDSDITIRTLNFQYFETPIFVHVPSGYKIACRKYNTSGYDDYDGTTEWIEKDFVLKMTQGQYYRFVCAYISLENITPAAASEVKIYAFTDKTLMLSGKAADAKIVGDEIQAIKGALDGLNSRIYKWGIIGTDSYPTGYRTGYFDTSGNAQGSDYYIRTRGAINSERGISKNDVFAVVTPPTGYAVRVTEKDSSLNFVRNIGDFADRDKKVAFVIHPNNTYYFSIGRFDNADASNYLTTEFTTSCVFTIYSKNNTFEQPNYASTYIWDSVKKYAIKLPDTYSSQKTTPCVVLCHGLSATITDSSWSSYDIAEDFTTQGYAVIDVDAVTTQDWCNPALIKRYVSAIADAIEKYNIKPEYVYGYSMGCLIALWLADYYKVKACAVGGIRLDFEARYATATAEEKAIIDNNLGFTNGFSKYVAAGWDKTGYTVVTDNEEISVIQFPPMFCVVGDSDTLTKTESLAKADAIKRGGTTVSVKEYVGNHTQVCHLDAGTSLADVLDWFNTWC